MALTLRRTFLKLASGLPLYAAESAGLKIRRVDPYVLRIGGRSDIVCVRIETEE